eukprot:Opistho-2@30709
MTASLAQQFEDAEELHDSAPDRAVVKYQAIFADPAADEESLRIKEQSIYKLGELYAKLKKATELSELMRSTRVFLGQISKAKAAKLVRTLLDHFLSLEMAHNVAVDLCQECIEWTKAEKRAYLRQALEARLIALYIDNKNYSGALALAAALLKELKKLDDKALLLEVQLLESKAYHALRNIPRARAALTSARTSANSIYCPPLLQASLDLQSGVLHAEEKDFKTAYSYFYEAFEGFDGIEHPKAVSCLKYMLLCKIMLSLSDEVNSIIGGKLALRYAGRQVEAMRSVAQAHSRRSLSEFEVHVRNFKAELQDDPIIHAHLSSLYDTLLEQNLVRIIEPFSRVEIAHVAKLIKLPVDAVENKLSKMILDKTFYGILDQGAGALYVFEESQADKTYEAALDTIQSMGSVVESLFRKAQKLS